MNRLEESKKPSADDPSWSINILVTGRVEIFRCATHTTTAFGIKCILFKLTHWFLCFSLKTTKIKYWPQLYKNGELRSLRMFFYHCLQRFLRSTFLLTVLWKLSQHISKKFEMVFLNFVWRGMFKVYAYRTIFVFIVNFVQTVIVQFKKL